MIRLSTRPADAGSTRRRPVDGFSRGSARDTSRGGGLFTRAMDGPATRSLRALVVAVACLLALALAGGCASDSGNGDVVDQGYQSGDGSIRTWSPAERGQAVRLHGTDFAGAPVDTGAWAGDVVVVNTWYAACPPCRKEAPGLVEVAAQYEGKAHLVGLNSTDDAGAAAAFQRTFSVTYPSIQDSDGSVTSALQGVVPIQAVPTTIVLDTQGRVAARVLGEASQATLATLIDDVLAEAAG